MSTLGCVGRLCRERVEGIASVARRWNSCKTSYAEAIYPPGSPYVYLLEWQMHRETARGQGCDVAVSWDRRRRGVDRPTGAAGRGREVAV